MPFESPESETLHASIAQMQADHGYAQFSAHDPASGLPGYAFTLGLETSRGVPELLCLGVAPDIASQLFSLVIEAQDAGTHDLSQGNQDLVDLLPGYTLLLRRTVPAMVRKANATKPESQADIGTLLQVLLPDNSGHFPGDPACDPQVAAAQDVDWLLAETVS